MARVRSFLIVSGLLGLSSCAALEPPGGEDPLALHASAVAAYHEGRLAEAEAGFRELSRRLPHSADPAFRLANLLARAGRLEEALGGYREALRRDPQHVRAWHNLAVTHRQLAVEALLEAADRSGPGDPVHESVLHQLDELSRGSEPVGGSHEAGAEPPGSGG